MCLARIFRAYRCPEDAMLVLMFDILHSRGTRLNLFNETERTVCVGRPVKDIPTSILGEIIEFQWKMLEYMLDSSLHLQSCAMYWVGTELTWFVEMNLGATPAPSPCHTQALCQKIYIVYPSIYSGIEHI